MVSYERGTPVGLRVRGLHDGQSRVSGFGFMLTSFGSRVKGRGSRRNLLLSLSAMLPMSAVLLLVGVQAFGLRVQSLGFRVSHFILRVRSWVQGLIRSMVSSLGFGQGFGSRCSQVLQTGSGFEV